MAIDLSPRKVALVVGGLAVWRGVYLFLTGQPITAKAMLFLESAKNPTYGTSSFSPYVPGATKPGPFALPAPNIATNQGSDVTIAPGDED